MKGHGSLHGQEYQACQPRLLHTGSPRPLPLPQGLDCVLAALLCSVCPSSGREVTGGLALRTPVTANRLSPPQHFNLSSLCICPSDLLAALSSSLQNKSCSLFKPGPSRKRSLQPGKSSLCLRPSPDPIASCNLGYGVLAQCWT